MDAFIVMIISRPFRQLMLGANLFCACGDSLHHDALILVLNLGCALILYLGLRAEAKKAKP